MLTRFRVRLIGSYAASLVVPVVLLAVTLFACSRLAITGGEPTAGPSAAVTGRPPSAVSTQAGSPTAAPLTAKPLPDGAVRAFTNPDGPGPADYPPDEYPFFEAARALPTFGQLWFDPNQKDVHLALTGDIDGAIETLGDRVPRGVTLYFHIVEYTQAELCALSDSLFADREELMRHGIVLTSGGCGSAENRVNIGISPLTPEVIAYMRSHYDGPIDYEASGYSALRPYEPPEPQHVRLVAARAGEDPGLATCGRRPFPFAALDGAAVDLRTAGPEFDALRESLGIYTGIYGDLSGLGWILAEKDDYGATFIADRGDTWLEAPVFAGIAGWVPATIDYCSPRPLTGEDGNAVSIYFDPAFRKPGPEATEIHVLIEEIECASGSSPASRLLTPIVRYAEKTVTLTVAVRGAGGLATCPSNPRLPVTIVLPEPLGDRDLQGVTGAPRY